MNPERNTVFLFFIKSIFWFSLWVCWLSPRALSAQSVNFLQVKGGLEHLGSRDRGMSPLLYSGNGFYVGLSWDKITPKHTIELALDLATGTQRNKYHNPIDYRRGNIQLSTFYHRQDENTKKIIWGWRINNVFSHRLNASFVNFNDHYEYFSNIGPAFLYHFPFELNGREVYLKGSGFVQLIGMMVRPSYTSSYPEGFLREESSIARSLVHSIKLIHPGNSFNFGIRPAFVYPLKSGNKLSLGYNYEFYRLNSSNTVTQSGGTWFISLAARL